MFAARILTVGWLLALLPGAARAQDSHYWNLQYGPVAELLGGVVVGSAEDLSATYYDPASLALAKDPAFLLSLNTLQLETVSLQSMDESRSISSSRFGQAPSLIAGKLPDGWLGSTRMAWSFLTRQDFKGRLSQRRAASIAGPPPARVGSETLLDQDMTESWGGLTWSRALGDRTALGVTLYGVYRSQLYRNEHSGQATTSPDTGFAVLTVNEYDYSHVRALAKAGLARDFGSWDAGLTVTTPGLGLFGSGKAGFTRSSSGLPLASGGDELLLNAFESDLAGEFKSSWAVAAGGAWKRGASRFSLTAEWFAPVDRYNVLDVTPFAGAPGAQSLVASLTQQAEAVLNGGVGFEHTFGSDLSLYAAFATDFSSSVESLEVNNGLARWNIYHLTGGTALSVGAVRFTLGVAFAFGSDERPLLIPGADDALPILGEPTDTRLSYRRLKFILGFAFGR